MRCLGRIGARRRKEGEADGSTRVVYAALAGNILVALSKFAAAALSGSGAMLTEAIHSSTDSVNQILLLIGDRRSRAPADRTHAFGYGMEIYFWTFVVAVMVLLAGGAASLYEGWEHLRAGRPIASPALSLGVLALSSLFEGASFAVGYREYKTVANRHRIPGQDVGLWTFIKLSKDPQLYESLLEDGAALIGIVIAASGVIASAYLGSRWADGAASIAIGLLLVVDAYVILVATRSLIAGETVAPALLKDIDQALSEDFPTLDVLKTETLHLGPRAVMVVLTIRPSSDLGTLDLSVTLSAVRRRLAEVDKRVSFVLVQFD